MGNVRKIGDEYYIEFYARGLLYQQKAGQDKTQAEELLRKTEKEIGQGEMKTIVRDVDIDVFILSFQREHEAVHPPLSWARYGTALAGFEGFLKQKCQKVEKLSQITPPIIEQYREYLLTQTPAVDPEEINLNIILLRDVFEYGIKLGYINDNPTLHTRFVAMPQLKGVLIPSTDEVNNLLAQAAADLKLVMTIIIKTGLRLDEALRLKWCDVDLSGRCLTIQRTSGSYQWARRIPMDRDVQQILKQAAQAQEFVLESLSGHALEAEKLRTDFKNMVERGGFSRGLNFESLRHTFARHVVQKGATLIKLYHLLGLDDIAPILVYIRFFPKRIA